MALTKSIEAFISTLDPEEISQERKILLEPLIDFIQGKVDKGSNVNLSFICTHNSRRSILTQVWAQAFAFYFKLKQVHSYSGGTESTAIYPLIADTLKNSGFGVNQISGSSNPIYAIKYARNEPAIIGFSKTYDHDFNPESGFAAVMTCSQADENCPFIVGAEKRIPITYDDPKIADDTPQQKQKYSERNTQIATELLYVFSKIIK